MIQLVCEFPFFFFQSNITCCFFKFLLLFLDVSSSGHFMPTNFGNQLPPRFPGNRGGYMNAPFNMRGPRPDMALRLILIIFYRMNH